MLLTSKKNSRRRRTASGNSKQAQRYHHGDLRRALVDEGVRLVRKHGHPAITVREVARRVGVSNTAAHYHFSTRSALLAAIAARGFEEMTDALEESMRSAPDAATRLARLGEGYVAHALRRGAIYQLMFSAETSALDVDPKLRETSDRMFGLLVDVIRACQEAGIARPGSPVDAALLAWSATHGIVSLVLDRRLSAPGLGERNDDELAQVVLRGIFTGLGRA